MGSVGDSLPTLTRQVVKYTDKGRYMTMTNEYKLIGTIDNLNRLVEEFKLEVQSSKTYGNGSAEYLFEAEEQTARELGMTIVIVDFEAMTGSDVALVEGWAH